MAIRTVNPTDAYNKSSFVDAMQDFNKLSGNLEKISSADGNWNPSARKRIGSMLRDDQTFYTGLPPDSVIDDAENFYSEAEDKITGYARRKFNTLLNKIKAEDLVDLVLGLPLEEVGSDSVKQAVRAINEKRKLAKAAKERRAQDYVNEKLANASDWRKESYFGYSIGNPDYTERTFRSYVQSAESDFRSAISDTQGKLNTRKLRDVLRANYQAIDNSTNNGKELAKAFQVNVAQSAYKAVK